MSLITMNEIAEIERWVATQRERTPGIDLVLDHHLPQLLVEVRAWRNYREDIAQQNQENAIRTSWEAARHARQWSPGSWDIRYWALALMLVGGAVGLLLPIGLVLTMVLVWLVIGIVFLALMGPTNGTSGAMGVAIMYGGGGVALFLPMVLTCVLREVV